MQKSKTVTIYTDGACSGNPGIGGWGGVLIYNNTVKEISGGMQYTTNNQMELMGVISSLEMLKQPCKVELYTDSKYIKDGITKWCFNWVKNNWKTSKNEAVKNKDLWVSLISLSKIHDINWHWVKGHADNELNNLADKLATSEVKKLKDIK